MGLVVISWGGGGRLLFNVVYFPTPLFPGLQIPVSTTVCSLMVVNLLRLN